MFRKRLSAILILILTAIPLLTSTSRAETAPSSSVSASRLAHLRHGINLSEWFAQVYDPKGYTKEHFETWTTATDIALIKSAGFDHVRLSVNPQPMMDAAWRQHGSDEYFGYLDAAMKMILDAGLAVTRHAPRLRLQSQARQRRRLRRALRRFLANPGAALLVILMGFRAHILRNPQRTRDARSLSLVRHRGQAGESDSPGRPANTIIATGAKWDDDYDMLMLEPLRDPNVIYVFHFYEPHIFTHQGATWGALYWHWLKDLHYPSNPANAVQAAETVPEAVHRLDVIRYGQDHWDASRIEAEINQASEWAKRNGVPLVCNEFGVYRHAEPQDRLAWLTDVRTALERHNIGWTMWDYSGSFGVVTKKDGRNTLDPDTVKALGLKVP